MRRVNGSAQVEHWFAAKEEGALAGDFSLRRKRDWLQEGNPVRIDRQQDLFRVNGAFGFVDFEVALGCACKGHGDFGVNVTIRPGHGDGRYFQTVGQVEMDFEGDIAELCVTVEGVFSGQR